MSDIVPFGKYKGQPVDVLAKDEDGDLAFYQGMVRYENT